MQVVDVGCRMALSVGVDLVPLYASEAAKAAVREAERASLVAAGVLPAGAVSRPSRLTEVLQVGVLARVEVHGLLGDIAAAQARLHALQAAAIVRLGEVQPQQVLPGGRAATGPEDRPDDWVADEVACVLGVSVSSAAWLVDKSRVLHTQLPGVWAALADAEIDVRRAQVLVDALAHRKRSAGGGLPDAVVDRVAADGLRWITEGLGPTPLADRVAGAVIAADPDEAVRRAEKRQRRQNVTTVGAGDGLAGFRADLLSAEDAAAMQARVDGMAAAWRKDGDTRPIGMLRVESLKQLVLRPWEALPDGATRAGWQLRLRADLADLDGVGPLGAAPWSGDPAGSTPGQPANRATTGVGTDGRAGAARDRAVGTSTTPPAGAGAATGRPPDTGCGPGSGVGSIGGWAVPPVAVAELLARYQALQLSAPAGSAPVQGPDASLRAVGGTGVLTWFEIIDATGRLRAVASPEQLRRAASRDIGVDPPPEVDGYVPSAGQVRFVRARDRHCRFPGCTRPAEYADLDHVIPYDHDDRGAGGPTCVTNLICLCRRHHRLKTHAPDWTFQMDPDGTLHVTLPSGTTRITRPPAMAETVITGLASGEEIRGRLATIEGPQACGEQPDPWIATFGPTPKRYRTPTPDEQADRRTAAREHAELAAIIDADLDARLAARAVAAAAAEDPAPF